MKKESLNEKQYGERLLIGKNEWCQLPDLKIPAIKAKIDTGARTSAIHAVNVKTSKQKGRLFVSFDVHPLQGNNELLIRCRAPVIDRRIVMSSNGHREKRYVISSVLRMGGLEWEIELTLSNRDPLRFRMLLGMEAFENRVLIHPGIACNQGKLSKKLLHEMYGLRAPK